jgi:hypothetical protein
MRELSLLLPGAIRSGSAETLDELSVLLGCASSEVEWHLLRSRRVYERTAPKKRNPSQHRVMVLLSPEQKGINRRLKQYLDREKVDEAVHGYVPSRSIWTALCRHFEGERLERDLAWFGFDIQNAFPSVSHRWVDRLLAEVFPLTSAPARAAMVNLLCNRGYLNPGYPTSPVLFNLALRPIDRALRAYCEPREIVYTRYADDFTFSSPRDFSAQEKAELQRIVTRLPYRFKTIKQEEASLGENFQVTHRSIHRFRRRLLRDQARGLSSSETVANLQGGRA